MTWIIIYLGGQNDPENGPLGSIFNTPLKVAQIDMYTKTDAQPVGKWPKTGILTYFRAQSGPKLVLWGPYSPLI